jgi:hypothetical protein
MMFASSSPEKLATAYSMTPERLEKEYHPIYVFADESGALPHSKCVCLLKVHTLIDTLPIRKNACACIK